MSNFIKVWTLAMVGSWLLFFAGLGVFEFLAQQGVAGFAACSMRANFGAWLFIYFQGALVVTVAALLREALWFRVDFPEYLSKREAALWARIFSRKQN